MNIHTPSDNILVKQALAPQAVGTGDDAVTGTGVNCQGHEVALFEVNVGAVVDDDNITVAIQLQESESLSTGYTDIEDATTGAVAYADQNEIHLIEVNLSEYSQYIRVIADGGSAGGGVAGVVVNLMRSRHLPPSQDNTVVQIGFAA